jgi:hypothetical protein
VKRQIVYLPQEGSLGERFAPTGMAKILNFFNKLACAMWEPGNLSKRTANLEHITLCSNIPR